MKTYRETVAGKMKRLILAIVGQALWVVPVGIAGYYAYHHLGGWCDAYFGIEEARQRALALAQQADRLSEPVLMTPGALWVYGKAFFASTGAGAKLYTLTAASGLVAGIGCLILYILGILGAIYAVLRVKRSYARHAQRDAIVQQVCREIMPELAALKQQVAELKSLVQNQSLKI